MKHVNNQMIPHSSNQLGNLKILKTHYHFCSKDMVVFCKLVLHAGGGHTSASKRSIRLWIIPCST